MLLRRMIGFGDPNGPLALAVFERNAGPGEELMRRVRALQAMTDYPRAPFSAAVPAAPADPGRLRVTWVIPDFTPGNGGHMTIFRIASKLESFGHDVSFLIQNPTFHETAEEARRTINEHFQPFAGSVRFLDRSLPPVQGDALIATDRFTCYPVRAIGGFRRKFYFVQDHETEFYPTGTEAFLTENTYGMGFDCLCAGDWLADLMGGKYGLWAKSWPLALDPDIYGPGAGAERAEGRIAFYARFVTPRRAVELGMMALDILHARGVRFHVDFFGWDLAGLDLPYSHANLGILGAAELATLYRRSSIGVVFSGTNHSLANREMMACGLPVVDFDLPNVRRVFPDGVMQLVAPEPAAIADGIQRLLESADRRAAIARAASSHIAGLSWEGSARIVEAALRERLLSDA